MTKMTKTDAARIQSTQHGRDEGFAQRAQRTADKRK